MLKTKSRRTQLLTIGIISGLAVLTLIVSSFLIPQQNVDTEAQALNTVVSSSEIESSSLTTINGQCGPNIQSTNVIFYCNESARVQKGIILPKVPGNYKIDIWGASSNSSEAGITVKIGTKTVTTLYWTGTANTLQTKSFAVMDGGAIQDISFVLTTDTGANDTILDKYTLTYVGAVNLIGNNLPATGSASSGVYRNLFKELGYSDTEINSKVNTGWDKLFYGKNNGNKGDSSNESVFTKVGTDMAFIEDINSGDIRSEGQSYGMMIALQMNKKTEFDQLWRFAKTYMKCPRTSQCKVGSGKEGYFSWQLNKTAPYSAIDDGNAPDGEEYFVTALIFAGYRWGNTSGINYHTDAQEILNALYKSDRTNSITSSFNKTKKIVVFSPNNTAANYSDPSYHLPAFYEVWGRFDSNATQKQFWLDAANASRAYFKVASGYNSGRTNGLMPDCTDLDGNAVNGCAGGNIYSFDAWRAPANIAVDYAWWHKDSWQVTQNNNIQNFFSSKGTSYQNQWSLDGNPQSSTYNSTGQISMNAVTALASNGANTNQFADALWNLNPPTGQYRYYDGMLYQMALLHLSGNFKIYLGGTTVSNPTSTPISTNTPTSTPIATVSLTPTATPSPTLTPTKTQTPTITASPVSATDTVLTIAAAGSASNSVYPKMEIYADGNLVATYNDVIGNPSTRKFWLFSVNLRNLPKKVSIKFTNDEASNTGDRNLYVDYIAINNKLFQTEDPSVYSTSCGNGNPRSEILYCNGQVDFTIN